MFTSWFKVLEVGNSDITYKYKKELAEFKIPQLSGNSHIYFNIAKALELNPKIKRLGLVFFMGIGDYFYATNFIEILRKEYPVLIEQIPKGLWGGKSWKPIVDEKHLDNCISYIRRHQHDNTKL